MLAAKNFTVVNINYTIIPQACKVYNVQPPEIMIREFCYMVEMI